MKIFWRVELGRLTTSKSPLPRPLQGNFAAADDALKTLELSLSRFKARNKHD
jgi:hypothetical protein